MLEPEIRILKGRRRKGEIISMQAFRPNDQFINSIKNIIELVHLCKLCASFKKVIARNSPSNVNNCQTVPRQYNRTADTVKEMATEFWISHEVTLSRYQARSVSSLR